MKTESAMLIRLTMRTKYSYINSMMLAMLVTVRILLMKAIFWYD
jgi:hypothetical protein